MLILGIDTGGTYTDGVILDRETRTVLHTAKALTTPENLSAGIAACMRALRFSGWEQIGMVGLSTTLATNAIVEGRGCRVGLLPLIRQLLHDVRSVMDALCVRAPLMIVRGDGSLMDAAYAAERPVETVLSGPAASVTGAQFLSGLRDGLVVDMGGTTTDIAAQLGWPCVVPRCAEVANAVGAAAGQVCESARALVRHNRLNDCFYVYTESCRVEAAHLQAAQELAREAVRRAVLEKAARAGAEAPEVTLREQLTAGEDGAFVEWRVTADAKGYPGAK